MMVIDVRSSKRFARKTITSSSWKDAGETFFFRRGQHAVVLIGPEFRAVSVASCNYYQVDKVESTGGPRVRLPGSLALSSAKDATACLPATNAGCLLRRNSRVVRSTLARAVAISWIEDKCRGLCVSLSSRPADTQALSTMYRLTDPVKG